LTEKKLSFDRIDVLEHLWSRKKWLSGKIDNKHTRLDPNLKARAALIAKECRICQAILQGLTDQELELRVMELETKLANGILIPKPQEEKKKRF
jgi:hypothetical protein